MPIAASPRLVQLPCTKLDYGTSMGAPLIQLFPNAVQLALNAVDEPCYPRG